MATPDVSVHVEEVVVVTTPDNPSDGNSVEEVKTVLVDFKSTQPSGGLSDDSMDSVNTPGTFTSSSTLIQKGDIIEVKIGDDEDNMVAEMIYPITCGESKANLVWKKFVCPGINVKCVQFDYQLISPKEFVNLAGKSTLKDWKRAIRLNGVMLRKIMDSGELDFYQHSLVCSNTCRSTKIDLSSARSSLSSQQSTDYIPVTPVTADVRQLQWRMYCADGTKHATQLMGYQVNGSTATSAAENCEESSEWITAIGEDAFSLWRGLKEAGLMDEIVQELQQELQNTLKVLHQRLQQPPLQVSDVVILNNIVQNFGLLDLVKKVLTGHKSQMDRSREQYTRDLAALEQQCDEHRKRAKELKHKSQHLNNVLMNLTPIAAAPPSKRPRLTRATSGPATVAAHMVTSSQPTQITLTSGVPVSQLTTIPIGKLTTVSAIQASALGKGSHTTTFTTAGSPLIGGYNVLASASSGIPNTVEMHPDASNLAVLSRAAIQDGNTLVKVVSPIQLYAAVPGLSAALQNATQMASLGSTIVAVPSNVMETTTSGEGHATIQVTSVCEEHEQKP